MCTAVMGCISNLILGVPLKAIIYITPRVSPQFENEQDLPLDVVIFPLLDKKVVDGLVTSRELILWYGENE